MASLRFLLSVLALHVSWVIGQKSFSNNEVEELWFEQKLDHFDPQNTQKWQQRYFVNHKAYKSGGPAFLYVGGEFEIEKSEVTEFSWVDYAKRFGALCFVLEHRYYGKSRPVEDLSLENLKYLNTHQALADLATFIVEMRETYNLSSDIKWIAFGGSYPGSLSTWLRIKYPHLIYAAVSSSPSVILEVDADYISRGLKSYALHDSKCLSKLLEGFSELDKHLETEEGRRVVDEKFNLCSPLVQSVNNSRDMSTLYYNVAYAIAQAAQNDVPYNYDYFYKIKLVCDHVTTAVTALEGLGAVMRYIDKAMHMECLDYVFDNKVARLRNTSWSLKNSIYMYGRVLQYQICNELGLFITSSSTPDIFGIKFPLEYRALECQYAFGEQYDVPFLANAVKTTNLLYGGVDMVSSNILFVEGSQDPWLSTQYSEKFKTKMPLIMMQNTTHCEDLFPATENDSAELKAARAEIASTISNWLNSKY